MREIFEGKDKKVGLDFIWKQIEISREIIEKAKPKIIVVNNTLARDFFGINKSEDRTQSVWMGYDFKFDYEIGTHRIIGNKELKTDLTGTPVIFTSMLTGQRALDNGSFERLTWHIDFVNKNL